MRRQPGFINEDLFAWMIRWNYVVQLISSCDARSMCACVAVCNLQEDDLDACEIIPSYRCATCFRAL